MGAGHGAGTGEAREEDVKQVGAFVIALFTIGLLGIGAGCFVVAFDRHDGLFAIAGAISACAFVGMLAVVAKDP